jgi:hypothetical protein
MHYRGFSKSIRGKQTLITPDGLDALGADVIPARPWGRWLGVGCVEVVVDRGYAEPRVGRFVRFVRFVRLV